MCPRCKAQGKELRLQMELGEVEVFCEEGHRYDSLADAETVLDAVANVPAVPQEAPAAAEATTEPSTLESFDLDALPGEPEPIPQPVKTEEIVVEKPKAVETQQPVRTPAAKPVEAKKPGPPPPSVARALKKMAPADSVEPRMVEGGAMLVTLRIEEEWVSAVKQEAENQGVSVQEHLQNVFTWGMQNSWFC